MIALLFIGQNIHAQTTTEKPNPRQLIDRGLTALGGKENLDKIFSKQILGTVIREKDGAVGTFELVLRAPDSYFSRITFGSQFEQIGFNGISGYEWNSQRGIEFLEGDDLKLLRSEAAYRNGQWINFGTQPSSKTSKTLLFIATAGLSSIIKFDKVKFEGNVVVLGQPAQNVGFQLEDGGKVSLSFDTASGNLVGEKFIISKGINYEYSDFRKVGDVMEPYQIRCTPRSNEIFTVKISRIILNQSIEANKFEFKSLPDLEPIIALAKANQEKLHKIYDQLTYEKKLSFPDTATRSRGEGMTDESYSYTHLQTFKVSFYRSFPIEILTLDNDSNPYSSWKSFLTFRQPNYDKIDNDRRLREIKKIDLLYSDYISRAEGQKQMKWDWGLIINDSLADSHFTNFRRGKILSKEMHVVDFTPKQILDKNPNFPKEMIAGRLWIDFESGWVAKAEIMFAEQFKKNTAQTIINYAPYSANIFIQKPVCDDLWLPQFKEQPRANFEATFSNYLFKGTEPVCDANNQSKLK